MDNQEKYMGLNKLGLIFHGPKQVGSYGPKQVGS